jgi:putative component of membrane protein insertase Oxa1/YidC/SpoIIIJ protein YidD/tetratricopeptide (TPR) repeat protein
MAAIQIYQRFLSRPYNAAFNPGGCPFSPSCSEYGHDAIRQFGILRAIPMTGDRLLRCHPGAFLNDYDVVTLDGRTRLGDPAAWLGHEPPTPGGSVGVVPDAHTSPFRRTEAPGSISGRSEYDFGMHLFHTKDYYRAITAFKRSDFFEPDTISHLKTSYMIPLSEFAAGRYGDAITGFDRFSKTAPPGRLKEASYFYQGRCWDQLGEHGAAQTIYGGSDFEDPELRDLVAFALGWSQLLAAEWSSAATSMRRYTELFPEGSNHLLARRIELDLAKTPPFGQKHMSLGVLYSIIPGGGQLYAGRPADAVNSLLLIGASAAIALRGAQEDSETALTLGTLLTAGFYLSNVYGGANAVAVHNAKRVENAMYSFQTELQSSTFDDHLLP